MHSKRILLIIPAFFPFEGAQSTRFALIAQGLASSGWECRIIGARVKKDDGNKTIEWQELPEKKSIYYWNVSATDRKGLSAAFLAAVESVRATWAYDVLFAYGPTCQPIGESICYAAKNNIITVCDCTEWYEFRPWRIFSSFYWDHLRFRRLLRNISGASVISSYFARKCNSRGIKNVLVPALAPSNLPICDNPKGKRKHHFQLTYIGALTQKRNRISDILQAVKILNQEGFPIELHCFGSSNHGSQRIWIKRIQDDAVLSTCVHIHPYTKNRLEVFDALANMDAAVLLRDNSVASVASFPTRLPEILMLGIPLITSDVGDTRKYLEHGDSCLMVRPGREAEDLVTHVRHLASHPQERTRMSANGRTAATEHFNNEKVCERLDGFLFNLFKSCKR
jgi:glycosyltransferase involved in cell wall biosynthesis